MAYVQSKIATDNSSATTMSATFDGTVAAGSVVVGTVFFINGDYLTGVTDDKSNTYVVQRTLEHIGNRVALFYFHNITNGPVTVTANFSSAVIFKTMIIHEYSGRETASDPIDGEAGQFQSTPGTGEDAVTSGAFTPTVDGADVVGFTYPSGGSSAIAPGTSPSFTEREDVDPASEDLVQTTAAEIEAAFTYATTRSCMTFGFAFKPVAPAGGNPKGPLGMPLNRPLRGPL